MEALLVPMISLGGIGALLASILVFADKKLRVEEDPKLEAIQEILPGANCGACGLPGCHQFAEAVINGEQDPAGCSAGGPDVINAIGEILGIEIETGPPLKARVVCLGGHKQCGQKADYRGIEDCRAAALVGGGDKDCAYGCLGYGSCVDSCPFGAMKMNANGLPMINDDLCTGCGICADVCPKAVISLIPEGEKVLLGCSSPEKAKAVKSICSLGCIGCSLCAKICPEEAIVMKDNLPIIDQEKCNACGDCIERCPTDSLIEPMINHIAYVKKIEKAG